MNEDVNPYGVAWETPAEGKTILESEFQPIHGTLVCTPEHYVTAFQRFRALSVLRECWLCVRWWIAGFFLICSVIVPIAILGGAAIHWVAVFLFPVLTMLTMSTVAIDNWNLRRVCGKLSVVQFEVQFTPQYYLARSEFEASELSWIAFTKAVVFPDGVLLFRGPKFFHWIPDAIFQDWDAKERLHQLICVKLKSNNVDWRCQVAKSKLEGGRLQQDWMKDNVSR